MGKNNTPKHSRLRPVLFVGVGFILGIAVTIGGAWLLMRFEMSRFAESDISFTENSEERLFEAATRLSKSKNEYDRWLALADVGMWNVDAGSLDRAEDFGDELLATAERYKDDWNYGNAIHKGHLILGRVKLRKGDKRSAVKHLLAAGQTLGSPQLNSFGQT